MTREKTLGQIAADARQKYRLDNGWHKSRCYGWDDLIDDEKASEEAAAQAIRAEVIEKCAKVAEADDSFMMYQDSGLKSVAIQKGENIAAAIRRLKEQPA